MNRPIPLTTVLACVALIACAESKSPDTDAAVDARETDAPASDGPSPADSPAADARACPSDAGVVACCCEGDVQQTPTCGGNGSLTCAAGYGLYFGADCSCTAGDGPCCLAGSPPDASDATGQ